MRPSTLECSLHGGTYARQIALEEIVRRSGLHAADGGLFIDGASDNQEGNARRPFSRERQRSHAIETGQRVIGENDVRPELLQLPQKLVPAVYPARRKWNAGPLELVLHELRIHRDVFENEDAKSIFRHEQAFQVSGRAAVLTDKVL